MFSNDSRISAYEYRGLHGRKIIHKASNPESRRVFLIVYGQHVSIERCLPVVDALSIYGDVYLIDTPGFGGMDSPYKAGEKASLSFYSGHLKNVFDEVLPKDKQITIFAISFGLQLVTQFLHSYPEYDDRAEDVISFVGLVSHHNVRVSKGLVQLLKFVTTTGKTKAGAGIYKHVIFRETFIRPYYRATAKKNPKFSDLSSDELQKHAYEQAWLWKINDAQTHAQTANDFLFRTDLTNLHVNLPITHIGVPNDHLLNNNQVVADLKQIYTSITAYELDLPGHAPVSVDDPSKILELIPKPLSKKLKVSHNKA